LKSVKKIEFYFDFHISNENEMFEKHENKIH